MELNTDGVRTLTGSTNLAYGLLANLARGFNVVIWVGPAFGHASSMWTWPVDPSCGFSFEDMAYGPRLGL